MTGLVRKGPSEFWSEDVWTLTMPVFPPLVVTKMDCESRIHTVLSSCLGSVNITLSVQTALDGGEMDEEVVKLTFGVLVWTQQICVSLDSDIFRGPLCK